MASAKACRHLTSAAEFSISLVFFNQTVRHNVDRVLDRVLLPAMFHGSLAVNYTVTTGATIVTMLFFYSCWKCQISLPLVNLIHLYRK